MSEAPVSEHALKTVVAHLAHLRASYAEVLAEVPLVEPNGEFFPDEFALEPEAIDRLLRRMLSYAPLGEDLDVALGFAEPEEGSSGGGGCGTGACGTKGTAEGTASRGGVVETETGYGVVIATGDVGEPVLLTSAMARAAGELVLREAGETPSTGSGVGPLSELTAVACGLGLLLLNGSSVYKKACGGMRQHRGTFLSVEELAMALAFFVRVHDLKPGVVRKHAPVTQREAFDAALAWVDGQPKLVSQLRDTPEALVDGVFTLEGKKGFFGRLFGGARKDADLEALAAAPVKRVVRSEAEIRRLQEARALVEDALQDG